MTPTEADIKMACKLLGGDLEFAGYNHNSEMMFSIPGDGDWIKLSNARMRVSDIIAGLTEGREQMRLTKLAQLRAYYLKCQGEAKQAYEKHGCFGSISFMSFYIDSVNAEIDRLTQSSETTGET